MSTITVGVSPKAPAAAGAVTASGLLASLVNLVVVGKFDTTSIILALSGSAGGLVAYAAAWYAKPGPVQSDLHIADHLAEHVIGEVRATSPALLPDLEQLIKTEVAKHFPAPEPLAEIPPAPPAPPGDFVPGPATANPAGAQAVTTFVQPAQATSVSVGDLAAQAVAADLVARQQAALTAGLPIPTV